MDFVRLLYSFSQDEWLEIWYVELNKFCWEYKMKYNLKFKDLKLPQPFPEHKIRELKDQIALASSCF